MYIYTLSRQCAVEGACSHMQHIGAFMTEASACAYISREFGPDSVLLLDTWEMLPGLKELHRSPSVNVDSFPRTIDLRCGQIH